MYGKVQSDTGGRPTACYSARNANIVFSLKNSIAHLEWQRHVELVIYDQSSQGRGNLLQGRASTEVV